MKKRLIIVGIIVILILTAITISVLDKNTDLINKIFQSILKQESEEVVENSISYQIYDYSENEGKMLITFQDDANGIDRIEQVNSGNVIKCYGNNIVSIDYLIAKDENYEFKMYTTQGEEVVSNITINDEFLYDNGINFGIKKSGSGYKLIELDYSFQDKFNNKNKTYYYKIGDSEESTWKKYEGVLWIFDYDIVKQELMNTSDDTLTIYAKSENKYGNEVIISKKYDIDKNATEAVVTEESILALVNAEYFTDGIFNVKVNGQTYGIHAYEFEESQVWSDDIIFGIESDVATATEDAKNMVIVKVNGDLTINSGVTVTAYASKSGYGGPKGMMIYCTGTLTNNGIISMTARGARAAGQNVYLWKNSNGTYEYVPANGANGGASCIAYARTYLPGNAGTSGTGRQTGGGGSGAAVSKGRGTQTSGAGSQGTSYSGGTGGGGASAYNANTYGGNGEALGKKGGIGDGSSSSATAEYHSAGGGAGNPGANGENGSGTGNHDILGKNGTGGLLVLYGNKINNIGEISSNGSIGGYGFAGGGCSGGGSVNLFYVEELLNSGYITTAGGIGRGYYRGGGNGGNGTITIGNISTGTFVKDNY